MTPAGDSPRARGSPPPGAALDDDQRQVVACRDRTIRLVAPAGAGKTKTVVERVLDRLARGLDPRRVLVLTFDTAAAGTVRARVGERARELGLGTTGLRVATLNAFGYDLLRRHAPREHLPVAGSAERDEVADEARSALTRRRPDLDEVVPRGEPREWRELFDRLKNDLLDPRALDRGALAALFARGRPELLDGVRRRDAGRAAEAVAWLFLEHDRLLAARGRIDFDDQKLRACQLLRGDRELRSRMQGGLSEVVVDEFQDINRLDFELVTVLAARAALVVVGDDDQAIYGFRGCSPEWIVELDRRSGRRVASLELRTNYRNPPNLLAHAVRLIRRNRRRIPKRPRAHRTDDAAIFAGAWSGTGEQAGGVAAAIRAARREDPRLRWRDFAVLYRMNAESRPLAAALAAAGIPCEVRGDDEESGGSAALAAAPPLSAARDAVSLRTYFRAKGLQWPVVFLTSCNEGVAPHRRSPVEDERRLFYVAMTRASRALHAYWLNEETGGKPSRFLREARLTR